MKTEDTNKAETINEVMDFLSTRFDDKSCLKAYCSGLGGHLDYKLTNHLIDKMKMPEYESIHSYIRERGLTPDISYSLIESKLEELGEAIRVMFNKWDAYYEILHALCYNRMTTQGELDIAVTLACERLSEFGKPQLNI